VTSGVNLEIYVHGDHEIFREFGRDPRDYAIMEIAQVMRAFAGAGADGRFTVLAAEITRQFPDQRTTDSALRDRAEACLRRIRDLAASTIAARPDDMWAALSVEDKNSAEAAASRADNRIDWLAATRTGAFSTHLSFEGYGALVRAFPADFLDGHVFTSAWTSWTADEARERQVGEVTRLLETVGGFLADPGFKSRQALMMTRLAIDMLDDIVVRVGG
jgi:hypothetical protein